MILARKLNESIMIGDDVEIVLVEIKGDQVKLGIRAPRYVTVHRTEIYREIKEQNKQAAKTPSAESLDSLASLLKKKDEK